MPKERLDGVTVTVVRPVPDRPTVCGEFDAESVTEIVPESDPVAVGTKVVVTVQLTPAFNVAGETGQLLVCAKFVLAAMETVVLPVLPVFFTVIAWLALVLPTAVAGKVNVEGVALTVTVAAAPVPVRPTDCGEFVA